MKKIAFSPINFDTVEVVEPQNGDEVMVSEFDLPNNDMVIAEEPAMKPAKPQFFDWTNNKDFKVFLVYLTDKVKKIPPHSGGTTVGCERAIKYLKTLDSEISKAFSEDMDCHINEKDAEKIRCEIRKMIKKLEQRHKQINDHYASDGAYASSGDSFVKEAQMPILCHKCDSKVRSRDELNAHLVAAHNITNFDMIPASELDSHSGDIVVDNGAMPDSGKDAAGSAEGLSMDEIDSISAQAKCKNCNVKLIVAKAQTDLECIKCGKVYAGAIKKMAYKHPKLYTVVTPFESAIVRTIINAKVSNGKNLEKTYNKLKEKYDFTDREELAIQQLLMDHGYPLPPLDRGLIGDKDADLSSGVELATKYFA